MDWDKECNGSLVKMSSLQIQRYRFEPWFTLVLREHKFTEQLMGIWSFGLGNYLLLNAMLTRLLSCGLLATGTLCALDRN